MAVESFTKAGKALGVIHKFYLWEKYWSFVYKKKTDCAEG